MFFVYLKVQFFVLYIISTLHCGLGINSNKVQFHLRYSNGAFFTMNDHLLIGNTITTVYVPSMMSCNQKCLAHPICHSFNYQMNKKDAKFGQCELLQTVLGEENRQKLQYEPGFVFIQIYAKEYMPTTCLDHMKNGALQSGLYEVFDYNGNRYKVYCDLTSEPGMAWTLVVSQSLKNRALSQFQDPLFENRPVNQDTPRWDVYRLTLHRIQHLKAVSTYWRCTCNFDREGLLYRDYVRVRFSDFDFVSFSDKGKCKKVEYLDVRGHNCTGCTAAWWQFKESEFSKNFLHHDSSSNSCQFGNTPGAVSSEDNFGLYHYVNSNFRCTATNLSTTNYWIGGRL